MSLRACAAFQRGLCPFLSLQWIFDLAMLGQLKNDFVLRILCRWDHWLLELVDDYLRYLLFPLSRCEVSLLLQCNLLKLHFLVIFSKSSVAPPIHGLDGSLKYHSILFSLIRQLFVVAVVSKHPLFVFTHRQS